MLVIGCWLLDVDCRLLDGWMDGWTDGRMDGWLVGWFVGCWLLAIGCCELLLVIVGWLLLIGYC